MSLEIFKLVGSIFVDNEEANKSLSKTDDKAKGVGETLAGGIKTAGQWAAGIAAGATAAAAGLTAFATNTAATSDTIDKMSQKIGISRESYQELDFITSQCGMSVDKFQTGMKTLTSVMAKTRDGTSKTATALEELGISAENSDGSLRSSEDVMYEAIAALQAMDNETERARLATELFGKAGSEMAPLLNAGAGSMEEMRQQAHDLGLILDDEVIDSGVNLTDTLDQLKRSFGAITTNLGGAVMPLVQEVAQYLLAAMPDISNVILGLAPIITELFDGIVPPLMELASELFPVIIGLLTTLTPIFVQIVESVLPVIVDLLGMLLPPMIQVVEALLPPLLELLKPILDLLEPLIQLLQPILDLVIAVLDPIAKLITDLLTPLITVISKLISTALRPLQGVFGTVAEAVSSVFSSAISYVMTQFDNLKTVFTGIITFIKGVFTGDWRKAWDGVKQIFSGIWDGIKEAFKAPINAIIDGINVFIRGINKIKIPDWVPGVGGKGFAIDELPRLAQGGVLEKGQMGLLEGNGAEAVVPLHQNRKWIDAVATDMDSAIGGTAGKAVEALLADILDKLSELSDMDIRLDTGALVGGLAKRMDMQLGRIAAQKARA